MDILCVNYEYPPVGGGGGAACKGLAESLVQLGHEVHIVTSGMKDLPARHQMSGVEVHRVSCCRRHRHYVTLPEMVTQISSSYSKAKSLVNGGRSFAINHTHFIVPSGFVSYRLWRQHGLPYVITIHGSDVPGYNPDRFQLSHLLLQPYWRRIVRNAAALIAPSNFLKNLVESKLEGINVQVLPYGIKFPELTGRQKENRILVVTRMFPRKGVQYLLAAMDAVGPEWELHVAGDGPYLPELKALAAKLDRPVVFHGFIRGQKLWDLYESAKIFVFPSIQENYPVVLLEAMSTGCAVVTTNATGCAEVVGDAAITVRPESVEDLRGALRTLTTSDEALANYSRRGQQRAAALCPKSIAEAHAEIFDRHAGNGHGA